MLWATNANFSLLSVDNLFLFAVWMKPYVLKLRSVAAVVAGILSINDASFAKCIPMQVPFHQVIALRFSADFKT